MREPAKQGTIQTTRTDWSEGDTREMQRILAMLLVMLLAFTVACGDDSDDGDDSAADVPTPTLTTGTGTGTGGDVTATTAGDDDDDDDADDADSTDDADDGDDNGDDGDAAAGETIAQAQCVACHSIDGSTVVGPTWQGLYGSEVELEGGETVTADDDYIRESIREPGAKIHAGFSNLMPAFDLDDDQVDDIIAYIRTLE